MPTSLLALGVPHPFNTRSPGWVDSVCPRALVLPPRGGVVWLEGWGCPAGDTGEQGPPGPVLSRAARDSGELRSGLKPRGRATTRNTSVSRAGPQMQEAGQEPEAGPGAQGPLLWTRHPIFHLLHLSDSPSSPSHWPLSLSLHFVS